MFPGLYPSALYTHHLGQAGGRGLSPRLWGRLAKHMSSPDGLSHGFFAGDDFMNFALTTAVASNVGRYASQGGGYLSYEDTGCSIANLATESGGVIEIATDSTDNDEVWIQPGTAASVLGKISDTAGDDKLTIFEARFQVGQIGDNTNEFVGLSEEGLAAADTVTDAGALADKDFIGFEVLEADGDALNFIYQKEGQTKQTTISGIQTLVADTWYKVGFVYDPTAPSANRIAVYVDNVENSTYVTADDISAATFPDAEELNFLAGLKNGSAAASKLRLDWWAFFQEG